MSKGVSAGLEDLAARVAGLEERMAAMEARLEAPHLVRRDKEGPDMRAIRAYLADVPPADMLTPEAIRRGAGISAGTRRMATFVAYLARTGELVRIERGLYRKGERKLKTVGEKAP